MESFLAGVISAAVALVVYEVTTGGRIWNTEIAECAVGQDFTLRDTIGTATFQVTFRDGKYTSMECISNLPAAPAE